NDCAGCHMPKRDAAVISHTALTNHRIIVRVGQDAPATVSPSQPELEYMNAPPGRSQAIPRLTLLKAYGEIMYSNSGWLGDTVAGASCPTRTMIRWLVRAV